jgi:type II secretory pathway pseudopilin PulG
MHTSQPNKGGQNNMKTKIKNTRKRHLTPIFTLLAVLLTPLLLSSVKAQQVDEANDNQLATQLQQLKKEVIALNRDLFILEEDLLFPSSTQVVVFLAVDVGDYFKLDAVELKIDEQTVTHYLYTEKQQIALAKGGVQKLHLANLPQGKHELTAFFIGVGPHDREYKRATTLSFEKGSDAKMLELRITDTTATQQPAFTVVEL